CQALRMNPRQHRLRARQITRDEHSMFLMRARIAEAMEPKFAEFSEQGGACGSHVRAPMGPRSRSRFVSGCETAGRGHLPTVVEAEAAGAKGNHLHQAASHGQVLQKVEELVLVAERAVKHEGRDD